jgi:hypothetical protein
MDSSVSPTHGEQEESAYNGHFACSCYHPLFLFNQFGTLERSSLRPGNVHSADGWEGVLKPVVVRYKGRKVRLYFRGDAAFASPEEVEHWSLTDGKYGQMAFRTHETGNSGHRMPALKFLLPQRWGGV